MLPPVQTLHRRCLAEIIQTKQSPGARVLLHVPIVRECVVRPLTQPSSAPFAPASFSRFASSLHTATFALCQIPDSYVQALKLPLLKRLSLVDVGISDISLESIIHSSCPALWCLLLTWNMESRCIRINSRNLVSIGIRCGHGELVIEDAPSL